MTHQIAQVADRGWWDEALGDQAVADDQVEVPLQHGMHRLPVNAGAFHADTDAVLEQPRSQGLQLACGLWP
jgi:hypothetical protein